MAPFDWVKATRSIAPGAPGGRASRFGGSRTSLRGPAGVPGFAAGELAARLRARAHGRRPLQAPLHVAAFGTNDWEQHGLWPALQRLGRLSLFDYLAPGS